MPVRCKTKVGSDAKIFENTVLDVQPAVGATVRVGCFVSASG